MKIYENILIKNQCYIVGRKMTPQGIVVHSTGCNNPYLKRYCDDEIHFGKNIYGNHWNNFNPSGQQIDCHAFIGLDINNQIAVAHTLPYNYCCWNCGSGSKGSYNFNPTYIQFEICEDGLTDKTYFTNVFKVAAEYCAYLVKEFNLPIGKIVSHKEANALGYASGHGDPDHWLAKFGKTMSDFRKEVEKLVYGEQETVEKCTKKFKAISSAKVRATKSANGSILGSVTNGATYDVDEITYIDDKLKWLHFKKGGYSMYVDSDNTTKLFTEVYTLMNRTTSATCNFRSDMVINTSNTICTIPKDTAIQVVKYSEKTCNGYTWYKVKYNGKYGYLASTCIDL